MNDENVKKEYDCEKCKYRPYDEYFCGCCMMRVLDEFESLKMHVAEKQKPAHPN